MSELWDRDPERNYDPVNDGFAYPLADENDGGVCPGCGGKLYRKEAEFCGSCDHKIGLMVDRAFRTSWGTDKVAFTEFDVWATRSLEGRTAVFDAETDRRDGWV